MTWEEIRQRKEDSIRESTGNPMDKSFESNGKIYNSFLEYANSDEYRQILDLEEKARNEYAQIAKEFFESFLMYIYKQQAVLLLLEELFLLSGLII